MSLFAASLISGCSTTPPSPKPHKTKYTFQCLHVTAPDSFIQELTFDVEENVSILEESIEMQVANPLQGQPILPLEQEAKPNPASSLPLAHTQIEELLKRPDITIVEFPVVYAAAGESVTNDQTKTVEMAVDANIINGKVVYKKEPCKLGKSVSILFKREDAAGISYQIDAMNKKLTGFDDYKTKEGLEVRMPYFASSRVNTKIIQSPNSWVSLGGLIHHQDTGTKMHKMILIQVLAPTRNQ